jgi:phosphoglycerate dehydrogenase-like enzyme
VAAFTRIYSAPLADRHAQRIRAAGGELVDLSAAAGTVPAVLLRTVGRAPREAFLAALDAHPDIAWVHTVAAGADDLIDVVPPHLALTRTPGPAGPPVAEFALAALLLLARDFPRLLRAQAAHEWLPPFRSRRLTDLRVLVLGWGAIGQATARLCAAVGMEVEVVRATPDPAASPSQHGPEQLAERAEQADGLVVACALTPGTRHLVNARVLAALGPSGLLVNVARGPVVDQDELVGALRGGGLGGAVLDVTDPEPLPADHELWDLPGAVVTPHLSGFAGRSAAGEVIGAFCENLIRFRAGRSLLHLVDPRRGY